MKIHSYESVAAVDGVGLRYGVFLSGCPLRCVYCHNPDTWQQGTKDIDLETLSKKLVRYRPYFKNGGGVTFSGGEPLLQSAEIAKLGAMLKAEGVNYAIDTSGCVELTDDVKAATDGAELIICDLKFWDEESYKKYCGGSFETVRKYLDYCRNAQKRLWIRTVVTPGINDSEASLDKYLPTVLETNAEVYRLLAFHTMGFEKYSILGIKNPLESTPALEKEKLSSLQAYVDEKLKQKTK